MITSTVGVGVSGARKTSGIGVLVGVGGTLVAGARVGTGRGVEVGGTGVAVGASGVAVPNSGRPSMQTALNQTRFSPIDPSRAIPRRNIVELDARAAKTSVS